MGHPWLDHMAKTRREHPDVKDIGKLAALAKKTYHHKNKKGGSAMGGELSPTDFQPDPNYPTTGTAIQTKAALYSNGGGKKSRRSKSGKKSSKKSRKSKSRSHKRR
jgi:hypothetical protein